MFVEEFEKTSQKKSKQTPKPKDKTLPLMKKDDGSTVVQMPELESDSHDYQKGY